MTTIKSALSICGLSQQEAAAFLNVRLDTVKSWCAGRANPPLAAWQLLASLFEQIQNAADNAVGAMDLDGIDPRAYSNVAADIPGNELPTEGAAEAAGAMALLMAIADRMAVEDA